MAGWTQVDWSLTEITEFDPALCVEEDVRRFDVSVDDIVFLLQIVEGFDGGDGHLAAHVLGDGPLQLFQQLVEASRHQLHAYPVCAFQTETKQVISLERESYKPIIIWIVKLTTLPMR